VCQLKVSLKTAKVKMKMARCKIQY
jgi:hypothetical protein